MEVVDVYYFFICQRLTLTNYCDTQRESLKAQLTARTKVRAKNYTKKYAEMTSTPAFPPLECNFKADVKYLKVVSVCNVHQCHQYLCTEH